MRLQRPVWYILITAFVTGMACYFWFRSFYKEIEIEIAESVKFSALVKDNVVFMGESYEIRVKDPSNESISPDEITWKVDDQWIRDGIVEQAKFHEPGEAEVQLLVNGKVRGRRSLRVSPARGAQVDIPNKLVEDKSYRFVDMTVGSIAREWYLDGEKMDVGTKELVHTFKEPGRYELMVKVVTPTEPLVFKDYVFVDEKPRYAQQKPKAQKKPKTKPVSGPIAEPVPVEEPAPVEEAVAETPLIQGFHKTAYFKYNQNKNFNWVPGLSKERCKQYTSDSRSIRLENLTTNMGLKKIWVLPQVTKESYQVQIKIINVKDQSFVKKAIKEVPFNRPGEYCSIDIEDIGSGLAKGESYTIIVTPIGNTRLADVPINDAECFNAINSPLASIRMNERTKILKLDFALLGN